MKIIDIIKKNIKLLLRSRIAGLVLVIGPLLIIMLVGISFSTKSFNLNIGTYSERYTELSNSLVSNLKSEKYSILDFQSEDGCIESIKIGETHACVVFPPDMDINNNRANQIKIYVDQSKVNLAYLVMSTLTSSFGAESSLISKELTDRIIDSLFYTKENLQGIQPLVEDIKTKNRDIGEQTETIANKLEALELEADSNADSNIVLSSGTSKIREELDTLLEDSSDIIESSLTMIDELDEWTSSNGTTYLNSIESKLLDLNKTIKTQHNISLKELNNLIYDINETIIDLSSKLTSAKNVNNEVIAELTILKTNTEQVNEKVVKIGDNSKQIISDIDSIEVTNSENIVNPITTEIFPIVKSETNLSFLFPGLVVMLIMFIGLILPSTLIIMEKNSKAYFRIFTTPTKNWFFSISTYLTSMMLIFFQVTIILLVSQFYFKMNVLGSFFPLLVSLFFIITLFIFLGMLIGHIFNSEEMAMLAAVSLGTLLLLTSGIIFPIESMPNYLVEKAKFNPMVLSTELFKRTLLFSASLESVKSPLTSIIILSLSLILLLFIMKKIGKFISSIRKPSKIRIKKEYLINLFDFGERKAKTLPEFIVSLQNLSNDKFESLLSISAYYDWLILVYKNKELGLKVKDCKSKEEIIAVLVEELKKLSEKGRYK